MKLVRTNTADKDFRYLVTQLDKLLTVLDGKDFSFYTQFNQLDNIQDVVVAYVNEVPAGCGALKPFAPGIMEVKRMFVDPQFRNMGIATAILKELELIAKEKGFTACVLETGKRQFEAVALYHKNGYNTTENYGQYIGVDNSVCMQKKLS